MKKGEMGEDEGLDRPEKTKTETESSSEREWQ
jgi:hypothetical protein